MIRYFNLIIIIYYRWSIVLYGIYNINGVVKLFDFRNLFKVTFPPIVNNLNPIINITLPQTQVKETFLKQVGERIMQLLDILINKYQFKKYK